MIGSPHQGTWVARRDLRLEPVGPGVLGGLCPPGGWLRSETKIITTDLGVAMSLSTNSRRCSRITTMSEKRQDCIICMYSKQRADRICGVKFEIGLQDPCDLESGSQSPFLLIDVISRDREVRCLGIGAGDRSGWSGVDMGEI